MKPLSFRRSKQLLLVLIRADGVTTGTGLMNNDGEELSEFAIAGANKKFVWAKAQIDGDKVVVTCDEVPDPLYVRYA